MSDRFCKNENGDLLDGDFFVLDEIDTLNEIDDELKSKDERIAELEQKLKESEEANQNLARMCANMVKDSQENADLKTQIMRLENENKTIKSSFDFASDEGKKLNREINKLKNKIAGLEIDNERWKDKNTRLKEENTKATKVMKEQNEAISQLQALCVKGVTMAETTYKRTKQEIVEKIKMTDFESQGYKGKCYIVPDTFLETLLEESEKQGDER